MSKREQIERALLALVGIADDAPLILHGYFLEVVKTLAEELVIECEVEHIESPAGDATRVRYWHDNRYYEAMLLDGIHGTPGKAIAIIVPLEEDFEEFIMTETEAAIEGGIIDENTGLPFDLGEE